MSGRHEQRARNRRCCSAQSGGCLLRIQASQSARGGCEGSEAPNQAAHLAAAVAAALAGRQACRPAGALDQQICDCFPCCVRVLPAAGHSYPSCTLARAPPQDELRSLSRNEWMARYGGVLQSEQYYDRGSPAWNYNKNSWWVLGSGRAGHAPSCLATGQRQHAAAACRGAERAGGDSARHPPCPPAWAQSSRGTCACRCPPASACSALVHLQVVQVGGARRR